MVYEVRGLHSENYIRLQQAYAGHLNRVDTFQCSRPPVVTDNKRRATVHLKCLKKTLKVQQAISWSTEKLHGGNNHQTGGRNTVVPPPSRSVKFCCVSLDNTTRTSQPSRSFSRTSVLLQEGGWTKRTLLVLTTAEKTSRQPVIAPFTLSRTWILPELCRGVG